MKHWPAIEPLESRRLLAAFFGTDPAPPPEPPEPPGPTGLTGPSGLFPTRVTGRGTLVVQGTDRADRIRLLPGRDAVTIEFGDAGQTVNRRQFRRIRVEAGGGKDFVVVSGRLGKPLTINGGTGNDRLAGGRGAETINGGAGNDTISAILTGAADDEQVGSILSGGRGDDTIHGSPGHDTVCGDAGRDVFRILVASDSFIVEPGPLPGGDDELTSIETRVVHNGTTDLATF